MATCNGSCDLHPFRRDSTQSSFSAQMEYHAKHVKAGYEKVSGTGKHGTMGGNGEQCVKQEDDLPDFSC